GEATDFLWAHARLTGQEETSITADVRVFDADGCLLLEVEGLRCQLVRGTRPAPLRLEEHLYEERWEAKERTLPAGGPSEWAPGDWLLFADQGGVGDRLAEQLT